MINVSQRNKDAQRKQTEPFPLYKRMKEKKKRERKITVQCNNRMDRYRILFSKTTSLIPPRWRRHFIPLYALCFVRACDGWRAWRHTPAVLIHHHIITKGLADWDDLLHPLARCCQTPSFSEDNSVTSTLPLQNKPTLMKDCCVSIKKLQIHCYWHQLECCTPSGTVAWVSHCGTWNDAVWLLKVSKIMFFSGTTSKKISSSYLYKLCRKLVRQYKALWLVKMG